jgi:hypothetical protein
MLTYIDSAVTKNAAEKKINSLLDFMSVATDVQLLQVGGRLVGREGQGGQGVVAGAGGCWGVRAAARGVDWPGCCGATGGGTWVGCCRAFGTLPGSAGGWPGGATRCTPPPPRHRPAPHQLHATTARTAHTPPHHTTPTQHNATLHSTQHALYPHPAGLLRDDAAHAGAGQERPAVVQDQPQAGAPVVQEAGVRPPGPHPQGAAQVGRQGRRGVAGGGRAARLGRLAGWGDEHCWAEARRPPHPPRPPAPHHTAPHRTRATLARAGRASARTEARTPRRGLSCWRCTRWRSRCTQSSATPSASRACTSAR